MKLGTWTFVNLKICTWGIFFYFYIPSAFGLQLSSLIYKSAICERNVLWRRQWTRDHPNGSRPYYIYMHIYMHLQAVCVPIYAYDIPKLEIVFYGSQSSYVAIYCTEIETLSWLFQYMCCSVQQKLTTYL